MRRAVVPNPMTRFRAAFAEYERESNAAFEAIETNDEAIAFFAAEGGERRVKLCRAFHEDTAEYNRLDTCLTTLTMFRLRRIGEELKGETP